MPGRIQQVFNRRSYAHQFGKIGAICGRHRCMVDTPALDGLSPCIFMQVNDGHVHQRRWGVAYTVYALKYYPVAADTLSTFDHLCSVSINGVPRRYIHCRYIFHLYIYHLGLLTNKFKIWQYFGDTALALHTGSVSPRFITIFIQLGGR